MKHASTRELFDYWNERRRGRIAPERTDIEPGAIRRILGDTFILAEDSRGNHRFRLAGTKVCALFSRELRGEIFITLWAEHERAAVRDLIAGVTNESAGIVSGASGRNAEKAGIELELLLLPLVHRDRSPARILGVLAPLTVPYWLGTSPLEALSCGTVRHLGPAVATVAGSQLMSTAGRLRHGLMVYDGRQS